MPRYNVTVAMTLQVDDDRVSTAAANMLASSGVPADPRDVVHVEQAQLERMMDSALALQQLVMVAAVVGVANVLPEGSTTTDVAVEVWPL